MNQWHVPNISAAMSDRPIPRATYRLQLTKAFPFERAAELAPYLAALGISHAYLSPIFRARRGSQHGYDVVDHTLINPELGGESGFERMAAKFRDHGLGIILDIVPNHMGVGGDENELWLDVLRHGRSSRYAEWFDIEWSPSEPTLADKVLVPFLGSGFGEALERNAFEVRHDSAAGDYAIWAEGAHKLPVAPETVPMIGGPEGLGRLNSAAGRAELIALIDAQHWRPARYSVAADDINYRRFFIVSDLAAIRVERDDVFERVHRLPFELVATGLVDGLRVDHIDGLYDPKAYCVRLREACPRPVYLLVEKILAPHESLRPDWQVDGTTGYEFATAVTRLLVDPRAEAALTEGYERTIGRPMSLADEERRARRDIADYEMAAELDRLTLRLRRLAASAPRTADLTRNALRSALREIVAAMPVYRSYVDGGALADADARNIAVAVAKAVEATPAIDPAVFAFIKSVLTGGLIRSGPEYDAADALDVAMRVQQYTGPVMAKGLEDTALFRYNRLLALSDVGSHPDRFALSVEAFHDFNRGRAAAMPHGLLGTSTHDTKRGEDTRARIAALSGCAEEWLVAVESWHRLLAEAGAPDVSGNDEYAFFQLLVGAWPSTLGADDRDGIAALRERLDGAMLKAVREARMQTNWIVPKTDYERRISGLIEVALNSRDFLEAFMAFERTIAAAGARNGLIETVLKLTCPGVPDIYQGAEFWEQSMVDPDNRRPVDFAARAEALSLKVSPVDLVADWQSGAVKQRIIADILSLRGRLPRLFAHGTYEPVAAENGVVAFLRRHEDTALFVAVRLYPWRAQSWPEPSIALPDDIPLAQFQPVLSAQGPAQPPFAAVPVFVGLNVP